MKTENSLNVSELYEMIIYIHKDGNNRNVNGQNHVQ